MTRRPDAVGEPQAAHEAEEWAASLLEKDLPRRARITVVAGGADLAASVLDADDEVLRRTEAVVDGEVATFRLEVDRDHRPIAVFHPSLRLCAAGVEVVLGRPPDVAETVSDAWL